MKYNRQMNNKKRYKEKLRKQKKNNINLNKRLNNKNEYVLAMAQHILLDTKILQKLYINFCSCLLTSLSDLERNNIFVAHL